jgi:hypothetical protein
MVLDPHHADPDPYEVFSLCEKAEKLYGIQYQTGETVLADGAVTCGGFNEEYAKKQSEGSGRSRYHVYPPWLHEVNIGLARYNEQNKNR